MAVLDKHATIEGQQVTSVDAAARLCQDMLGQRLTAWTVGVKDPKSVGRWIDTGKVQKHEIMRRLLALATVVSILRQRHADDGNWTRAWLLSPNPRLGDATAAEWIHDDHPSADVIRAARAYVE